MIEVERKFRTSTSINDGVIAWLNKQGAIEKGLLYQVDTVFLLKSDSFKDFKRGDPVIRLRMVNEAATLTYKRAINERGDLLEHEMAISSFDAARAMLEDMGYKAVVEIKKTRKEYAIQNLNVALDEVEGLGLFLEIEDICEPGEEAVAESRVFSLAEELGLDKKDLEAKKYDVLLADKQGQGDG